MVAVTGLVGMIKHHPETMKLIRELMVGNISDIKPISDLETELGFAYPQVQSILGATTQEAVTTLEFLVSEDVLQKCPCEKLQFCPRCQSPNLKPGLGCPNCGSVNIAKGRVLEHFTCLNNGLEEEYLSGSKYVCPKCKQELRFLGTDYQSLGIHYKCYECGMISKEAASNQQCSQCSLLIPDGETKETVLYLYRLNETKRRWLEFQLNQKGQFIHFLRNHGYEVTENAKVSGTSRSGAEHQLDILAQRDDGLIAYTVGIDILIDSAGREIELDKVFAFDSKIFDMGIHDKVLIAVPNLSAEARQYAQQQRIKIIEEKDLTTFLGSQLPSVPRESSNGHVDFETKAKLLEHLERLHYRVEEKARIQGRSGVEHTFDILAYYYDGIITHTLGINVIIAQDGVDFDAVSSFDTSAYDACLHDKVLLVCPRLDHEAKQFAQCQRIKVVEVGDPTRLTQNLLRGYV
jgi:hypothetical protein